MLYFIADANEDRLPTIDTITDKPSEYISQFEPIDIMKGQVVAWDELGNFYHFGPDKALYKKELVGNMSWVDVGEWDYSKGEPHLIKIKEKDGDRLKEALIIFLTYINKSKNKRNFWRLSKKKDSGVTINYSNLSLHEVIEQAKKTEI